MRYPFDKFKFGTPYGQKGSYWKCGWHSGQDFMSANYGGDGLVRPIYQGFVMRVNKGASYGNCVYIKHPDNYVTLYAHMNNVYVHAGMSVNEDTILGTEGRTGNATGTHLHLEVHKNAYNYPAQIDPIKFIEEKIRGNEMEKQIEIKLNGVKKTVTAIEKNGYNYVKLQDLRDSKIAIGYDKIPTIEVVK